MARRPARIMVIAAHPQDPFERAGGTVAKHLERSDEAMFVSLTTGVVTHAFGVFPPTREDKLRDIEKIKDMKRGEFESGCRILGLTQRLILDFPESPMVLGLDEHHRGGGLDSAVSSRRCAVFPSGGSGAPIPHGRRPLRPRCCRLGPC